MLPEFEILGISFGTYGFFTSIGILAMTAVALKLAEKTNISRFEIILGEFISLITAFLGAHFLYAIVNLPSLISDYLSCEEAEKFKKLPGIIFNNFGGMIFYGGLIFGILFGFLYCKIRKIDVNKFSDCFAVGIPLFHFFGRIGCFFAGCCYGIESSLGFTTTNAVVAGCNFINRFPVQLLESFLNLILFFVLLLLFNFCIFRHNLIFVYLNLYSIIRFLDEFLRGDIYRGFFLGLSTSQWISVILFIISASVLIIKYKPNKEHPYKFGC